MPLTLAAGIIAQLSVSSMPDALGAEQLEQLPLLGVVGAGRVAERRPDAAVALGDQLVVPRASLPAAYHSRRARSCRYSANASASRSASALTMIAS